MANHGLELVELRGRPGDPCDSPFVEHGGFNERWWSRAPWGDVRWFEARRGAFGVARVQLIDGGDKVNSTYVDVPSLGRDALKIQFIEVHADHRCQRLGTEVLGLLSSGLPGHRLFAYSEADGFWTSLGWLRFEHPNYAEHPTGYQVLFIQPAE